MHPLLQLITNLLLFAAGLTFAATMYPNSYKDPVLTTCGAVFSMVCTAAWIRAFRDGSRVARVTVILTTLILPLSVGFSLLTFNMGFGYSLAVGAGCLCYQLNLAFNPKGFGMKQFAVSVLWSCFFAAVLAGLYRFVMIPAIDEERIVSHQMRYTVNDFSTGRRADDKPTPPEGWKQIRFCMDTDPDQAVVIVSSDLATHLGTLPGPTVRVDLRVNYLFRVVFAYSVHEVEGYRLLQHQSSVLAWNLEERLYDTVENPRGIWKEQRKSTVSLLDRQYARN
jgi:hypothetical protein